MSFENFEESSRGEGVNDSLEILKLGGLATEEMSSVATEGLRRFFEPLLRAVNYFCQRETIKRIVPGRGELIY